MSLETSASESEEKDVNEYMFADKMCLTVCVLENCALMDLILLMNGFSLLSQNGGCSKRTSRKQNSIYYNPQGKHRESLVRNTTAYVLLTRPNNEGKEPRP